MTADKKGAQGTEKSKIENILKLIAPIFVFPKEYILKIKLKCVEYVIISKNYLWLLDILICNFMKG